MDMGVCACEAQRILRQRICGQDLPPLIMGYDTEIRELEELIKRTATVGESNSILVIGSRGSGKTMIIKKILMELDEVDEVKQNLLQVHLNGKTCVYKDNMDVK
ncbi:hypothetical protein LSH36_832g01000 [Paralvinella palmiformis]|uniref:Origin recognition complex subunit 4 n=1 Tax=Paralvinella palmiformis TaxID=53620 RepID=A0AAD9J018_9ANNE|nr:hypothetical protein LSH36_832g01000 [Paralvinella palmiformis]